MPTLQKREKVLVQYRLLKDFDELLRRGIPGIDVRVMEENIYEWHVTMSPLSGHFSGLRLHLVLLFPEDYPRRPPKVELCTYLPHANVFRDFLTFAGYFAGYEPVRGKYVICTDLLEDKPRPLDAGDSSKYDGWSVAYSVESVLVQLQCLLFDDYVQSTDGNYINTLWDNWYSRPGEGRKGRLQVCAELHRAQKEADGFCCAACGFSGRDHTTAFYDACNTSRPEINERIDELGQADEEGDSDESDLDGEEGHDRVAEDDLSSAASTSTTTDAETKIIEIEPMKDRFTSRKKQRKLALAKQKRENGLNTKVDFRKQKVYMEIANSNSALIHGRALRRIPGVFKPGDVVSFLFHGVEDGVYINGHGCINRDLQILNYGHDVEFPWCTFDITLGRTIYRKEKPHDQDEAHKQNKGKANWKMFVNSQGGGSSKSPADTPGTVEYIKKREKFHPVGVVEYVNPHQGTVTIVVVESGGQLGTSCQHLTDTYGPFAWNSEAHASGEKATLYKNVPMEKVSLDANQSLVVPYDNAPPVNYKPVKGHYGEDRRVEYELGKDMPMQLVKLFGTGQGLTRQKLAMLPWDGAKRKSNASASLTSWELVGSCDPLQSFAVGDRHDDERSAADSFEVVSALDGELLDSYEIVSMVASSFDIISVVDEWFPCVHGSSESISSSFHLVPSLLRSKPLADCSLDGDAVVLQDYSGDGHDISKKNSSESSVSSKISAYSLLSFKWPSMKVHCRDSKLPWEFLKVVSKLNIPIRGTVKSVQSFGAFFSVDATPTNLAIRNHKLLPARKGSFRNGNGKGKGKGRGKESSDPDTVIADGLLPCLPYMRPSWPEQSKGNTAVAERSRMSVMVDSNIFDDLSRNAHGRPEMVVFVNEVDVDRQRFKLSLQPRLTFDELSVGAEYDGIVVDCSKQNSLGLFVALSDNLVGLLHRTQLGVGAWEETADGDEWFAKRSVYKIGDRLKVWVVKKEVVDDGPQQEGKGNRKADTQSEVKKRFKIELTMEHGAPEVRRHLLDKCLQVMDSQNSFKISNQAALPSNPKETAMDLQIRHTYDKEDKYFLIKNNRLIQEAEQHYPDLVIDYTTDPPPAPPAEAKHNNFDFSLINGWDAGKITREHKRISDKKAASDKHLSKEEAKLFVVLEAKVEQWGKEYYDRVAKKVDDHHKRIQDIYKQIKEERDKYPHKSIIDLEKFRDLTERIKEKQFDKRCCFVTRLSYKEDVLGVGLEIRPEPETGRKVFHCSFDLLSKEAFYDFGIRSSVWKDKIQFWMPAAIDSNHFRRALYHLAECFRQLGDGRVEKMTRSYGTQTGAKYNMKAQIREAERHGGMISLDDYKKKQTQKMENPGKKDAPISVGGLGLTEQDMAYGLEVLPKLMNLQTVQLLKGDLHLSTKALEGYMGFHHLILSIVRQFPTLQQRVEQKIAAFLRTEAGRTKTSCPNIGEFLCLLAVSRKYTWDDVSAAVLKETLDRNASWAIDKFPSLAKAGISDEIRLERTFRAGIVSHRLLCFNVWFLRNIVFKKFGETATTESILADQLDKGPKQYPVDKRWEEYEERKGIPKPCEVDLLQEYVRQMMHGDGLNSWYDYFVHLNLKPVNAKDLSQFLRVCFDDAVGKGYIPRWKLHPKPAKSNEQAKNDFMGKDVDKYDDMFTKSGSHKW